MDSKLKVAGVLLAAFSLYLALTFLTLGRFPVFNNLPSYPADDTYIYMAMSRNLMEWGVWGVTKYDFTGTSSSHLWVILLAFAFKLFGTSEIVPLTLNFVIGLFCFGSLALIAKTLKFTLKQFFVFSLLFIFIVFPSHATVFGMETLLHGLLCLLFVWRSILILQEKMDAKPQLQSLLLTWVITALFCSVRYESPYAVGPVILILLTRGQWKKGLMLFSAACTPVFAYGLFAISKGQFFFPNTILLKGNIGFAEPFHEVLLEQTQTFIEKYFGVLEPVRKLLYKLVGTGQTAMISWWLPAFYCCYLALLGKESPKHSTLALVSILLILSILSLPLVGAVVGSPETTTIAFLLLFCSCFAVILLALFQLFRGSRDRSPARNLWEITVLTMGAHLLTAAIVPEGRYETYLLALALLPLFLSLENFSKSNFDWSNKSTAISLVLSLLMIVISISVRDIHCYNYSPKIAQGVRSQHIEMANFVKTYFGNATVVLNDIGAVCFYAKDAKLVDLYGLASKEVAFARAKHHLDSKMIESICKEKHADLAVLQEPWYEKIGLPQTWKRVAKWKTMRWGVDEVSFFAVNPEIESKLEESMRGYKLPAQDKKIMDEPKAE